MKKTALITGASKGIGFETALKLCEDFNYNVIAVSRNAQRLSELQAVAPAGTLIPAALNIVDGISSILDVLKSRKIGHIDLLINNAGFLVNKKFEDILPEELLLACNVNFLAPYRLIQSLLPWLRKSQNAHIVNISSMGGFQGAEKFQGLSAYSSTKAALACLTECLAVELKDDKIMCNCLCLGAVETEMLSAAFPGYKAKITALQMAVYIARFGDEGHRLMNGRILPVALSNP